MAQQTPGLVKTFACADNANNAIAANIVVVVDASNGGVKRSGAATTGFVGVSIEAADTNNFVAVQTTGIVQITAGGTISKGDYISSDANGKAVTATAVAFGGTTVSQVIGIAMNAATSGNLVDVLIQPFLDKV